jgi:hypothetical protein
LAQKILVVDDEEASARPGLLQLEKGKGFEVISAVEA